MTSLYFPSLVRHLVASPTLPPLRGVYEYIFASNGIFLRATNAHVSVQLCIHSWLSGTVRGLPALETYIHLHHPRLPCALLHRVLADARTRRDAEGHLIEAFYRVVPREGKFALIAPPQQASAFSVRVSDTDLVEPSLLELHSHGNLAAFWSVTDDRDEGGFRFYAVVGKIEGPLPEIRLRLGVYGYWWDIPLHTLFEEHDPSQWQDLFVADASQGARWLAREAE
jgi:PRTRC genetic system protein A